MLTLAAVAFFSWIIWPREIKTSIPGDANAPSVTEPLPDDTQINGTLNPGQSTPVGDALGVSPQLPVQEWPEYNLNEGGILMKSTSAGAVAVADFKILASELKTRHANLNFIQSIEGSSLFYAELNEEDQVNINTMWRYDIENQYIEKLKTKWCDFVFGNVSSEAVCFGDSDSNGEIRNLKYVDLYNDTVIKIGILPANHSYTASITIGENHKYGMAAFGNSVSGEIQANVYSVESDPPVCKFDPLPMGEFCTSRVPVEIKSFKFTQ